MHTFVDTMLRRMSTVKSDADIESLLGHLAEVLGYRSAFLLDFPKDGSDPIRLWDSNEDRGAWWRQQTLQGTQSISRSLTEVLSREGVQHLRIDAADPRYNFATRYDFVAATVVPITFDHETRGVACFSGEAVHVANMAMSLEIVCYALLMQARLTSSNPGLPSVTLTPRELEVVDLSAQGMTSEMIAGELGLSPRTVNQHIDNIGMKLKTRNRVHTVAEAIRRGLLN
ncbi:MAG: helix-turn-helix transcriptional regulator [Candidatus Devosia phytovorans]|uniref:Helix-turn-helix transcriptional regulator n=1 Tax=Candidatus Devosia phytovorans TaxID=3121372 RepID=A0AAJ5VUY9_9HYPH|nr:helix-turn-helix transcriptional regulator [Devosia sp.]WEK03859.1 MAG: helix-turn-helix transcriptional regulator [Devosia sp.]